MIDVFSNHSHINVGFGEDISIVELAALLARITGFDGVTSWDLTKPDGTSQKLLDSAVLRRLGWRPVVSLEDGLRGLVNDFKRKFT